MNKIYKLERKFGKYSIKNLPFWLIAIFSMGYLIFMFAPDVTEKMIFVPYEVFYNHEYWRLFTWILTPVEYEIDLLSIFMLFIYFSFANAIERATGTFLFNLYILGGVFLNFIASLAVSIFKLVELSDLDYYVWSYMNSGVYMTQFMYYSLLLAFALIYAESMMLLYFIIPIKAKYIAFIDMIFLAYEYVNCNNMLARTTIIACLVNWALLYMLVRSAQGYKAPRKARHVNVVRGDGNVIYMNNRGSKPTEEDKTKIITRHKCAVCGRTENDGPDLEFRFCSKCNGNYEYCSDHLYTHEHVK